MNNSIDKPATEEKLTWAAPRLIVQELTGTEGKSQTLHMESTTAYTYAPS